MLWSLLKGSIPKQTIFFILVALLFWLFGWSVLAMTTALFAIELTFFRSVVTKSDEFVYCKDIFKLLSIEVEQQLRVGMDRGRIANIHHIELWQQDQHGYIAFTLNMQTLVRYKFPVNQYQATLDWFKQNLPNVSLRTSF